ncbi:MAG: hypothetical protein H6779_01125 [Candidatus Nomurabacteria bacterium]|nr:hypothetical protein [Candidatus Nomurabacteria bacterium]USN88031.1 MAG: hypothetical protein H6779_01125 [Candidatus Nomurabacteria bacterium]
MSFNTIIEAEKEADLIVETAKEKAKQLVTEAVSNQAKQVEEAKSEGEAKIKTELANFEAGLNQEMEQAKAESDKQLTGFEQEVSARSGQALKQILTKFK